MRLSIRLRMPGLSKILLIAIWGGFVNIEISSAQKRVYRTKKIQGKAPAIDGSLTDEAVKTEKRLTRREAFAGDWAGIGIDSYKDETGFGFTVNAAGVKSDGIVANDNNFDDATDKPIFNQVFLSFKLLN